MQKLCFESPGLPRAGRHSQRSLRSNVVCHPLFDIDLCPTDLFDIRTPGCCSQVQGEAECTARDLPQTGTVATEGFLSHFGFRRRRTVRALEYGYTLALSRCRCTLISLYTFPRRGLARYYPSCVVSGFAEFDEIHAVLFGPWCSSL